MNLVRLMLSDLIARNMQEGKNKFFCGYIYKREIQSKVQKAEREETRAEVCGNRCRAPSRQPWVQEHTDDGVV